LPREVLAGTSSTRAPASVDGPFTQSGNVWDDTGEPLEL
jgi:hypothetical protein